MAKRITAVALVAVLLGLVSAVPAAAAPPVATAADRVIVVTGNAWCTAHLGVDWTPAVCASVTLTTSFGEGYSNTVAPRMSPIGGIQGSYRFEGVPVGERTDFITEATYTVTAEVEAGATNDRSYTCTHEYKVIGGFLFSDQYDDWFGPWSFWNRCDG